ncbi:hypothetical protein Tco_0801620 [Tanacetum coccineum]|uniref:Retroviral polymerase SH3-like domain-containing protein n=1 Tax=Tanacetum coccineum TaxID=301880 RepID=A0ABQ4ZXB7_9ASTR
MMKHHTIKMHHDNGYCQPIKQKQPQQQLIPINITILNIKLPILKKEEYDIWAIEMEHYLEYIDNDVWKVIQNGNSKKRISTGKYGVVRVLPPVSAVEIHAVEKERKARTILLMAIPKEHLRRFHGMDDAKEIWEAIRTRFGGNANSKKMQKAILKQQFEAFTISSSEGLENGYDRFQQLLSQLEAHGAEVSTKDANHKFLRSLPPAWSNLAMTMRTKPDDTLSIDDFKSSTNKVKSGHTCAYSTYTPSTSSNNILEQEVPAGFADEKTRRRVRINGNKPVGFDKKKLECFKCHNTSHFSRECTSKGTNDGKKRDSFYQDQGDGKKEQNQNCLLTMDDSVVNWGEHTVEEVETNHALMAISSDNKRIGMKAVKDKEQLQKTVDSWKDSFKNLWKLVDSGMSSTSKVGLGYEIKSNDEGPQKPDTSVSDDKFSKNSVTSNEEVMSKPKPKEAEPSCVTHIKTPKQSMKNQGTPKVNGKNWNEMMERELGEGYSFIKKKCFVCGSLSYLIRDYDFYEKKMVREVELKKQRVFNTVQLKAVRQNVNSVRSNVNTGRANVNSVRQNVNSVRSNVNIGSSTQEHVGKRFSWVFFLAYKDETSGILQNYIRQIEYQLNHRVKIIRSDNDTEFKNRDMLEFYTLSVLGKFDGKCDEGFLVGYLLNSKAFRVYNLVTKKVEVNLHVKFLEEKPNVKGVGYRWMFDINYLTDSMNYIPVSLKNQTNPYAGTSEVTNNAGTLQTPNANAFEEEDEAEELIVVPIVVRHTASKVGPRKSCTNLKADEFLTELQNLKTQEKEAYSTGISKDTPKILAFRRELDELASKHLREVPKNKATSTNTRKVGI